MVDDAHPILDVDPEPAVPPHPAGAAQQANRRDTGGLLPMLSGLIPSVDPIVVLTSLAAVCVPAFCDECSIDVVDDRGAHSARYPVVPPAPPQSRHDPSGTRADPHQESGGNNALMLTFEQPGSPTEAHYRASMTWRWTQPRPDTVVVIARLLLDRATDMVRTERLLEYARVTQNQVQNLQVALDSNREIGQAIGILMSAHKLTSAQAFHLLRGASQHTNRKLRDIASDVTETGALDVAREPATVRLANDRRNTR